LLAQAFRFAALDQRRALGGRRLGTKTTSGDERQIAADQEVLRLQRSLERGRRIDAGVGGEAIAPAQQQHALARPCGILRRRGEGLDVPVRELGPAEIEVDVGQRLSQALLRIALLT